jgi:hypothetical protein
LNKKPQPSEPKAYFFLPCPECNYERIRIEEGMVRVMCPGCKKLFEIHVEILLVPLDKDLKPVGKPTAFRDKAN